MGISQTKILREVCDQVAGGSHRRVAGVLPAQFAAGGGRALRPQRAGGALLLGLER